MSGKDTLSQAEIDALLAAVAADPEDAHADGRAGRAKRIQNMDFRRPSKFNKDQLHTLEMLHDTFSRLGGTYLSSALRCMPTSRCSARSRSPTASSSPRCRCRR